MRMRNRNQYVTLYLVSCLFFISTTSSGQRCLPHHSSTLLQLKREFQIRNPYYDFDYDDTTSYPKMEYWKANSDCCSWDGVTCNNKTGQVVGLDLSDSWLYGPLNPNSSLFSLRHLQKLNLGFNDFNFSTIPSEIGQLARLSYLNLSNSSFSRQVPSEISWLANLLSLDLSYNYLTDRGSLKSLAKNMTHLEELHLDYVDISSSLPQFLVNLSSLTSLSLLNCSLHGEFPKNIFLLPKMQAIDLSSNKFLTGALPEFPSGSSLKHLALSYTNFSGKLPNSIGNLKSLNVLLLDNCNFSGIVPPSLGNLSQLTSLSLEYNHFYGQLPSSLGNLAKLTHLGLFSNIFSGEIPPSLGNLTQLSTLDISNNQLVGPIPSKISRMSNLEILDLSNNSLTGEIPSSLFTIPSLSGLYLEQNQLVGLLEFQNISSSKLGEFTLSRNKLNRPIPRSIANLTNLGTLHLSSSIVKGTVELNIFFKLEMLTGLDLSGNNLSFTNESINSTFPIFEFLDLSSCNIREFPNILETQEQLQFLNLSNNRLEGKIPKWFWNLGIESLTYLDLSHNLLSSFEQPPVILPWKHMSYLNLRSNSLQGSLPIPPLWINYFFASENKFTGIVHPTICKLSSFEVLDVSNNSLSGLIPKCLGNFDSSLSVLNLRMNKFQGKLALTFTNGSRLRTLDFSHNQLQGKIPQSLVNCTKLEVLNLGNNDMSDTFPFWLDSLPELKILVLRENGFHGPIRQPHVKFDFSKLHIIDLSYNSFTGELPSECFKTWNAMLAVLGKEKSQLKYMGDDGNYYTDSVTVMNKGTKMELVKILTIFTAIDLSNNRFHGDIPDSMGNLKALIVLSLSSNNFTGPIPSSFVNLKELQSLDLSRNKLSGRIPQQLTSLTFLEYLNLSQNQLVGPIPQGGQFSTFENSSFQDNLGLCGTPLSKKCEHGETPTSEQSHEPSFEDGFTWKAVVMGYACGLLVGLVIGHVFITRMPSWFARTFRVNLRKRR